MIYIVTNRDELYHAVMITAHIFRASITSGGRTVKRNKSVGGTDSSQHQLGIGWDLVPDNYAKNADPMVKVFLSMGCYAINEGDHVHVQLARRFLNASEWVR